MLLSRLLESRRPGPGQSLAAPGRGVLKRRIVLNQGEAMTFSKRRVLGFIFLVAALFALTIASGLAGQFRGSLEPARSAGWTWDDSAIV